jgi:hypothetical protein
MNTTESQQIAQMRRKKQIVGAVAIALLVLFTILRFTGLITSFEWLIADLIVFLVANLIFRLIGKPKL